MSGPVAVSADEARCLQLRAQGLLGTPPWRGRASARVGAMLRGLGAVQLDTISVLARSHELVAFSRLGAVDRSAVEAAYWHRPARAFEYWAHAACILPIESWPWCARRRRRARARRLEQPHGNDDARREVLARLADLGPVTTAELGGARTGGAWWDWSPSKVAVEELLDEGEVVCVERRGWRRVYDLAERAVPSALRAREPSDEECAAHDVGVAARALGCATAADLAEYHRLPLSLVPAAVEAAGLVAVRVAGWSQPGWSAPEILAAPPPRGRHRTTLLSPFDSLVWDRRRTQRVFGFTHRIEAYTPAPQRAHGYYAMPLLHGGRLVGRADPVRRGQSLVARRVSVLPAAVEGMVAALCEAAAWVGCDSVVAEACEPPSLLAGLRAALRAAAA